MRAACDRSDMGKGMDAVLREKNLYAIMTSIIEVGWPWGMERGKDLSRRAVALFFVVLLCIGLLVRYDFSSDEGLEMRILKSNGAEYVAQFFGEDSGLFAFY